MQNIAIELNDIVEVDQGVQHAQDYAAITVVVDVTVDGETFNLNYQSTTNHSWEASSTFGLDSSSGDMQNELAAKFDFADEDGDKRRGEYSEEFERIEAIAKAIAQEAADKFFAALPEKTED
jgi:hypothetical protein